MKLELKHLSAYLPYGLKIKVWFKKDIFELPISYLESNIQHIKPILRPLSDLTKEIEHNGKKFVPLEVILGCDAEQEKDFQLYGIIPYYWKYCVSNIQELNFKQALRLFEWHFDVFGLIEKGLAIDINTLKQ